MTIYTRSYTGRYTIPPKYNNAKLRSRNLLVYNLSSIYFSISDSKYTKKYQTYTHIRIQSNSGHNYYDSFPFLCNMAYKCKYSKAVIS